MVGAVVTLHQKKKKKKTKLAKGKRKKKRKKKNPGALSGRVSLWLVQKGRSLLRIYISQRSTVILLPAQTFQAAPF